MRILFVISHYYSPDGNKKYNSASPIPINRINALNLCISSIHNLFGKKQYFIDIHKSQLNPVKNKYDIDIVICTAKDKHILNHLPVNSNLYTHYSVDIEPMMLGFECQRILKENLNSYDYYCQLEDDIIINDPNFFTKLSWFNSKVDNICLLQPNRYEVSYSGDLAKIYIDGNIKPELTSKYQNIEENARIVANIMDNEIVLQRPLNPHSGCYFLNQVQMEYWTKQPYFYDKDTSFIGPLESAATLGVMKTFKIYKPASFNAEYLEVQHYGQKFINIITERINQGTFSLQN